MWNGLGSLATIVAQAQQMGEKLRECETQLAQRRFLGVSGGGQVEVEVSGQGHVTRLSIAPQLIDAAHQTQLETLVPEATNQALAQLAAVRAQAMQGVLPDLSGLAGAPGLTNLSGLSGMLAGLLGKKEA